MATATRASSIEQSARSALLGGACTLVLGLGLVGVGATSLGALPVLVGLALTILAIHVYGRLGPDEPVDDGGSAAKPSDTASDRDDRREVARGRILRGALTLLVSAAVIAGTRAADPGERGLVAAVAFIWGVTQVVRGWNMRGPVKRGKARVEKRRRMDKSPAP